MPVTIEWDNEEPTVIRTTFTQPWQWEDYQDAIDRILVMCRETTARVDMITDFTHGGTFPAGNATPHIQRFRNNKPANFGLLVVVNPNLYVQTMINTVNAVNQSKDAPSIIVKNVAQAHEVIQKSRALNDQ